MRSQTSPSTVAACSRCCFRNQVSACQTASRRGSGCSPTCLVGPSRRCPDVPRARTGERVPGTRAGTSPTGSRNGASRQLPRPEVNLGLY